MVEISFQSCDGKLGRAKTHMQEFRDELRGFDHPPSHTITVEDDPDTSSYVFYVHGVKEPPSHWSYLVGDCLNNLRAALDHMAFQLSILGKGAPLTPEEAGKPAFPITPQGQKELNKGGLGFLRAGEKARILELQPLYAGDASIWGLGPRGGPRNVQAHIPAFLARLDGLNNVDKHRLVHPAWRCRSAWGEWPLPPRPEWAKHRSAAMKPLKDGAEIERWFYEDAGPKPQPPADVDMHTYFPIGIALGEPSDPAFPPYVAGELLANLTRTVEIVLDIFRPCIGGGAAVPLSAVTASPLPEHYTDLG